MIALKPIDFVGIISLDQPSYDQLNQFLYEKEGQLGACIVQSIRVPGEASPRVIIPLKLSEALENFEKRIRQIALSQEHLPTLKDFNTTISLINEGLWQYVETLESCVIELFQQLDQAGLEKWTKEKAPVVNSLKIMLMHRMEDASWAVRRIETLLRHYGKMCVRGQDTWTRLILRLSWWHLLDRDLLTNLEKSKKYLRFRHKKFTDRVQDFNQFYDRINQTVEFKNTQIYTSLDSNQQDDFKRIYELLNLWELNQTTQSLPAQDIVWAIRHIQDEERVYQLFYNYYQALRDSLFHQARLFKLGSHLWKDSTGKDLALEIIGGYRAENHTLRETVQKYQNFLKQTDQNRYRGPFAKWLIGSESKQCKRFLGLKENSEFLDDLYEKLRNSLEEGPSGYEENELSTAAQNIEYWLHASAQPLASQAMMHTNVIRIINTLADLNELGSFNKRIVDFFNQVLSKTLRVDWKYNVAFEIPKFHEVYQIHMGLIGYSEDRQHFNRLHKFKQIIQQIKAWAKKKTTQRHVHEIEQDMSEIKAQLQDLLAYVQRMLINTDHSDEVQKDMRRQLLEYRYLFGQFLHQLSQDNPEERTLHNHFLFIYQYLEAIELKLNSAQQ